LTDPQNINPNGIWRQVTTTVYILHRVFREKRTEREMSCTYVS
jgi:hypothetical protein